MDLKPNWLLSLRLGWLGFPYTNDKVQSLYKQSDMNGNWARTCHVLQTNMATGRWTIHHFSIGNTVYNSRLPIAMLVYQKVLEGGYTLLTLNIFLATSLIHEHSQAIHGHFPHFFRAKWLWWFFPTLGSQERFASTWMYRLRWRVHGWLGEGYHELTLNRSHGGHIQAGDYNCFWLTEIDEENNYRFVHPGNLTWNPNIGGGWKMLILFNWVSCRFKMLMNTVVSL